VTDSASEAAWSDESSFSSDIDGRADFAKVVSSRIAACAPGSGSTVFGLVGPWGSGKSTLIGEVRAHLADWTIVDFSPWSVSDSTVLTSEFIATLVAAFPRAKTLRKRLAKYSRYGAPALNLIPTVGGAASKVAETLMSDLAARPPWHAEFGELSKDIGSQGIRVLVVVDDVDRLDADELRALFRVVRLLGRFTNVHYLLAYDQSTIEELLANSGSGGHSSDYTEKIVQYPFELPPVPKVLRRRWARGIIEQLDPITGDGSKHSAYADQREQLVSILTNGLGTPRAAQRLREQVVSLGALAHGAEVDVLDFIALTWIRITHHRLWDHIRLHQEEYLGWSENDSAEVEAHRDVLVARLLDRGEPGPAQGAVRFLFASVGLPGAFAMREWRMNHARFFDRYFLIGVPQDDVSDLMIGRALKTLQANEPWTPEVDQLESILSGHDQDRAALALESVNRLQSTRGESSIGTLALIDKVRMTFQITLEGTDARSSGLERWLNRTIFLVLRNKAERTVDLVERYGYEQMAYSAYFAHRQMRGEPEEVRAVFQELASIWIAEIQDVDLMTILSRPELIQMTSFLIWTADSTNHRGFLSSKATNAESVLQVAMRFVSFAEWVGTNIHYEVVFREQEFRFALGDVLTASLLQELPARIPIPDYEIDDLLTRVLGETQRRDFALHSLAALELMKDQDLSGKS
jgi:hypothetical protein